jgi:hypothetical protein
MRQNPYLSVAVLMALAALSPMRAAGETNAEKADRAKGMALQIAIVLHEQADRKSREGKPAGSLARSLADRAGLDDTQAATLSTVALRLRSHVAPLDERARQIIQEARQRFPGGRLPPGVAPPPPPPELADLQRQRNAAVAQAVVELDRDLGPAASAKLVEYMTKAEEEKSFYSVPVRSPNQIGPPGEPVRPRISQPASSSSEVKK